MRSMKEKTSMNQEIINVKLLDDNGVDTLLFEIPEIEDGISVNLNTNEGQNDLKKVFENLLVIINKQDVELKLEIAEQYKKGLYKEVCAEYIDDLNKEIKAVRAEVLKL